MMKAMPLCDITRSHMYVYSEKAASGGNVAPSVTTSTSAGDHAGSRKTAPDVPSTPIPSDVIFQKIEKLFSTDRVR